MKYWYVIEILIIIRYRKFMSWKCLWNAVSLQNTDTLFRFQPANEHFNARRHDDGEVWEVPCVFVAICFCLMVRKYAASMNELTLVFTRIAILVGKDRFLHINDHCKMRWEERRWEERRGGEGRRDETRRTRQNKKRFRVVYRSTNNNNKRLILAWLHIWSPCDKRACYKHVNLHKSWTFLVD